jgi:hypothetical protein
LRCYEFLYEMGYPGICFLKSDFPGTPFHRGRDIVILSIRFLSLVGLEDEGCDVVDWVCISNPRKHFGIDHTRGKSNHTRGKPNHTLGRKLKTRSHKWHKDYTRQTKSTVVKKWHDIYRKLKHIWGTSLGYIIFNRN